MSLAAGTRLGPYEIVAPLGAGGMGEVYRARDTTLHREVAIKVLLDSVANDPDRLARFAREAQVLASLNHPNIAHIHGVEDTGGVKALVLELVDGEDLAQRITRGPIPVGEALAIARQIADALEAAHEQGVIHRDLKPANIKIRPDGTIKVLDFGLAKALDPGTLAVVRGEVSGPLPNSLVWVDRSGRSSTAEPASGAPAGSRGWLRLAPDGSRAIVGVTTALRFDLWIADWTRDVWTLCAACRNELGGGVWSPDGRRLLLGRDNTLVAHTVDDSAPDQVLVHEPDRVLIPESWLADGRIVYTSSADVTNFEMKFLEPGAALDAPSSGQKPSMTRWHRPTAAGSPTRRARPRTAG